MSDHHLESQLKEACAITGAYWAAWVESDNLGWAVRSTSRINKSALISLSDCLSSTEISTWLDDALSANRDRIRVMNSACGLAGNKLQVFPVSGTRYAVLVAFDKATPETRRIWRLVAGTIAVVSSREAQYERLQRALQDLQETQQELQARIAAQQAAESRMMQTAKLAAVGEMAAGVAHELNNPLTTVVGFTELVVEDLPADSQEREDMQVVLREARRARDVVRRLLDFSRRSEMIRTKSDINEIIEDTLSLMNHLLRTSGVDLVLDFEGDLPWVMMDRNQIKQVLLNLFNNSLNAMPQGGKLNISTRAAQRYGVPHVAIAVEDTGVGIPVENLDRIFEPFFTTRAGHGGTGLGLSVTFGIISEHGGAIEVVSAPGVGSTFTVWLPVEGKA